MLMIPLAIGAGGLDEVVVAGQAGTDHNRAVRQLAEGIDASAAPPRWYALVDPRPVVCSRCAASATPVHACNSSVNVVGVAAGWCPHCHDGSPPLVAVSAPGRDIDLDVHPGDHQTGDADEGRGRGRSERGQALADRGAGPQNGVDIDGVDGHPKHIA